MKIYFETQFITVFDSEKIYNKYLAYNKYWEKEGHEISLSNFLDHLEEEYEIHREYEELIAFRKSRERIYDLLTKERKMREGPQNLEE